MLSVELGKAGEILSETGKSIQYSKILKEKSKEIKDAIYTHGVITDKFGKLMFAYEVDGFGSYYLMDDANSPSLLSLPFLDFIDKDDPIYLNTRKFVLSNNNPYFYEGKAGFGIGGPHNGNGWIWPMSIIIQALTSNNDKEIIDCLKRIINSTGEKNLNLFGEMMIKISLEVGLHGLTLFLESLLLIYGKKNQNYLKILKIKN